MTDNEKALDSLKRLQELSQYLPVKRLLGSKEIVAEAVFDYVEASCSHKKAIWCHDIMLKVESLSELIAILEEEISYDVEYAAGNQELPY